MTFTGLKMIFTGGVRQQSSDLIRFPVFLTDQNLQ